VPAVPRPTALTVLLLALVANAEPAPSTSAAPADLASLREEYRALQRIQAVLGWYTSTQGEESLGALSYLGHEHLFSPGALALVDAARSKPGLSADEALGLRFLRRALAAEQVNLKLAHFDDEFDAAEGAAVASVPFEKAPIPYRNLPLKIAAEPDPARRAQLYAASTQIIDAKLNPILVRKEAAAQEAARAAGYTDYVAMSEELRAVKLQELLAQGVAYVRATNPFFKSTVDRVAREELGIGLEQIRLSDFGRLWKSPKLGGLFEKDIQLAALQAFLGGIGLDLKTAAGGEVKVDDSLNPLKRPRAFVNPVDPPRDVRLSVKPQGGLDDTWTLFHEAGHAVHFASTTVEPWENKLLGHGGPTEAFGEFFRHAFSDPRFLRRYRDFLVAHGKPAPTNAQLAAVLRRTALIEMYYLRRYAFAKIAYELRLHGRPLSEIAPALELLPAPDKVRGSDEPSLKELYRQAFSVAYGFALNEQEASRFRVDVDDSFYSADYARAFALAGMMHEAMRKKFGQDWYGNPAVGKFLREQLFSRGTALSPEEVAVRLGFPAKVDFDLSAKRAARLLAEADALEAGH
jgi:hypothetical protein